MKREEMIDFILKHDKSYSLKQLKTFSDVHIKAIYIVTSDAIGSKKSVKNKKGNDH
jgi:hypothetical protein